MAEAEEQTPIEDHDTSERDITDSEAAAAIDELLRSEFPDPVENEPDDDPEPVQVPPIKLEPVYAWPVHGLFVLELSYADFDDLGKSEGGTVSLGKVLGTEEHPHLIQLRDCIVLFREDAGERWLLRGHWYRFLESVTDIVAVITSSDTDPRIANLQAMQQAEATREVLFNDTRRQSEGRLPVPTRDYADWP